jgi:hypothetical protein
MTGDPIDSRIQADALSWQNRDYSSVPRLDDAVQSITVEALPPNRPHHWRIPTIVACAATVIAIAAVTIAITRVGRRSEGAATATLKSCGMAPTSTASDADQFTSYLVSPATARGGSRIDISIRLMTKGATPVTRDFDSDPSVVVLQDGHVVGRYAGAIGGTGLEETITPRGVVIPTSVRLSGCPKGSDGSDPDSTRRSLPPGRYYLAAVLEETKVGSIVTPVVPIQIV